jgi:hypothetical protein
MSEEEEKETYAILEGIQASSKQLLYMEIGSKRWNIARRSITELVALLNGRSPP